MHFLPDYGLFIAKLVTVAIIILLLLAGFIAIIGKAKEKKEKLKLEKLNDKYRAMRDKINHTILSKEELKKIAKEEKAKIKAEKKAGKNTTQSTKKIFVINFCGDIKASAVSSLREEITAILTVAKPEDEVLLRLESSGGLVHAYGLAASQLKRLRTKNIPLTIAVDKVAASGGYMMACVANQIIAAPFAIVGSIGVIAQLPNFNRVLKKHNIEFEQIMAGEYKRTLTLFGENTDSGREKFRQEIEETHHLFKAFIIENRPQLDIDKVATGEHWYGTQALTLQLIDQLITSDDYLLNCSETTDIYEIKYLTKKTFSEKLAGSVQSTMKKLLASWQEQNDEIRYL